MCPPQQRKVSSAKYNMVLYSLVNFVLYFHTDTNKNVEYVKMSVISWRQKVYYSKEKYYEPLNHLLANILFLFRDMSVPPTLLPICTNVLTLSKSLFLISLIQFKNTDVLIFDFFVCRDVLSVSRFFHVFTFNNPVFHFTSSLDDILTP